MAVQGWLLSKSIRYNACQPIRKSTATYDHSQDLKLRQGVPVGAGLGRRRLADDDGRLVLLELEGDLDATLAVATWQSLHLEISIS